MSTNKYFLLCYFSNSNSIILFQQLYFHISWYSQLVSTTILFIISLNIWFHLTIDTLEFLKLHHIISNKHITTIVFVFRLYVLCLNCIILKILGSLAAYLSFVRLKGTYFHNLFMNFRI